MTQHTPGPWKAVAGEVYSADGRCLADLLGPFGSNGLLHSELKANVDLLASAPSLLAALEPLAQLFSVADGDVKEIVVSRASVRPLVIAARAAIAQAKGE